MLNYQDFIKYYNLIQVIAKKYNLSVRYDLGLQCDVYYNSEKEYTFYQLVDYLKKKGY